MPINPTTDGNESRPQASDSTGAGATNSITSEMVNAIADKVYTMLLLELKYESERLQFSSHRPVSTKGGR